MPYPLPDGDSYEESLRWFLVAVPDRPEYVTAGLGAYTEFGNRYLWGLEGPTDESEGAAQSWHFAIAATLEALEMGFPDILLDYIDDVETLLKAIRDAQCCAPGGSPISNTGDTLEIIPIGIAADEPATNLNDPTTWPPDYETDPTGATGFSDLAAISDNLCRAANAMFVLLLDFVYIAGWFVEAKYALAGFIREITQVAIARLYPTVAGSLIAFAYDALGSDNDANWQALDKAILDGARSELETIQEDVVCAWANADTYSEALSASAAIITSTLTSNVAASWILGGGILGFVVALLFRMWADPLDYTCVCEPEPEPLGIYARATVHEIREPDNACDFWVGSTELQTLTDYKWGGNVANTMTVDFFDDPIAGNRAEVTIEIVHHNANSDGVFRTWNLVGGALTLQDTVDYTGTGDVSAQTAGTYDNVARFQDTGIRCTVGGYLTFRVLAS